MGLIGDMMTKSRETRQVGSMEMTTSAVKAAGCGVAERRGSSTLMNVAITTSNRLIAEFREAMSGTRLACTLGIKCGVTRFVSGV